jgi:hypothetical protein
VTFRGGGGGRGHGHVPGSPHFRRPSSSSVTPARASARPARQQTPQDDFVHEKSPLCSPRAPYSRQREDKRRDAVGRAQDSRHPRHDERDTRASPRVRRVSPRVHSRSPLVSSKDHFLTWMCCGGFTNIGFVFQTQSSPSGSDRRSPSQLPRRRKKLEKHRRQRSRSTFRVCHEDVNGRQKRHFHRVSPSHSRSKTGSRSRSRDSRRFRSPAPRARQQTDFSRLI